MAEDLDGEAGLTEIDASEILDKIQRGEPVEYDRVTIKGDLDIRKLDLPKENEKYIVSSSIIIINSRIEGNVVFREAIFRQAINFELISKIFYRSSTITLTGVICHSGS